MTLPCLLKTIDRAHVKAVHDDRKIGSLWKEFGQAVREERRARNIKLAPFAASLGISKSFVGFLETGKRRWDFDMAKRAIKLLTQRQ